MYHPTKSDLCLTHTHMRTLSHMWVHVRCDGPALASAIDIGPCPRVTVMEAGRGEQTSIWKRYPPSCTSAHLSASLRVLTSIGKATLPGESSPENSFL